MAGDWIKMRTTLHENLKVLAIADATGIEGFAVVGRLHRLWSWLDANITSCHAVGVTDATLDRVTCHDGFARALRKVGWITGEEGGITFVNFDEHNGQTSKMRSQAAQRQSNRRNTPSRSQRDGGVTKSAPEKRTEEKSISPLSPPTGGQFKRSRRESFEERIARLGRLTDTPGGSQ